MLKAMLFVDAGWLHASLAGRDYDETALDPRRWTDALIDEVERNDLGRLDLVRSHWYVGLPENHHPGDAESARRLRALVGQLEAVPGLRLQAPMVDHGGRRLAPAAAAGERLDEATIAVALGVDLLRHANQPASLDLAIVVAGGAAYVPLLQEVRRLGKRVVIAALQGSCAPELAAPRDPAGVRDFDVVWLEPLLGHLDRPRGRRPGDEPEPGAVDLPPGQDLTGRVKNIIWDRGYGFIAAEDGRDYFFHANALEGGLEFDDLQPDLVVTFEIKSGPVRGRAGAARRVWRDGAEPTSITGDDPQPDAVPPPIAAGEDETDQPLVHLQDSPPPK